MSQYSQELVDNMKKKILQILIVVNIWIICPSFMYSVISKHSLSHTFGLVFSTFSLEVYVVFFGSIFSYIDAINKHRDKANIIKDLPSVTISVVSKLIEDASSFRPTLGV